MSSDGPTALDESHADENTLPGRLTQLGLILGPASLVALFCQVLDASNRTTGASSLAAVCLTSICIYRRQINRTIPPTLLTALLVALGAVFFFNYQNILLKDTGLIKWYRQSNQFLAEIEPEISKSRQEIWFMGTDFNISAGEQRDLLLKKLSDGVNIKFLIFDPKSPQLDELASDFDQSPAELRAECEKGLDSIIELQRKWQTQSSTRLGELDVRFFDANPRARFYIFDPNRTDGHTYFVPYVNDVNSPNAPGYLLQNIPHGVFQQYFDGIRKLWASSETMQQHLNNPAAVH